MKEFNDYIIEKLRINKDIKVNQNEKEWLSKCEKIIFDYLDHKISKRYYDGEVKIEYSKGVLNIIFFDPIAYSVLSEIRTDICRKLRSIYLIDSEYKSEQYCLDNHWTIIIYKEDEKD